MRIMWWAAAVGVALALGLAGVITARGGWDFSAYRDTDIQHQTYDRPITTLVFDEFRSGDVVVAAAEAGDAGQVVVERVVKWNGTKPAVTETWSAGTMTVRHDCGIVIRNCSIRYTVRVPASVAVRVEATSGDVQIGGITGPLTVHSTSGDVTLSESVAPVAVTTTSGNVSLRDVRSPQVEANATSGDVKLSFDQAPQSVSVQTTSGNVTTSVPHDPRAYKVDVVTTSGERRISVDQSPDAGRAISVHATSGDVTIGYR